MENKNGSILIVILIFISVLLIVISGLSYLTLIQGKSIFDRIQYTKAYYLAESGLNILPKYFDKMPVITISKTKPKLWIYQNLNQGFELNHNLDGKIILFKTNTEIFSVGIIKNKFRVILKKTYEIKNGLLILNNWQKI